MSENPFIKKAQNNPRKSNARKLMLWHLRELTALEKRCESDTRRRIGELVEGAKRDLTAIERATYR